MSQCFPDRLNSARLSLRRLQPNDEEPICAYRSLPQVARYQYWDKFSPDDAARLVKEQVGAEPNIPGTWFQLAIIESKTGRIIGDCGLHCRKEDPHQMEIGITLAPSHQGLRYSDEAVECLLDYVFRSLDKHRVFARVDTLNRSAIGLCQRMGFREEAHLVENVWFKGSWGSEYVFAMLKQEWASRVGQRKSKRRPAEKESSTPGDINR